MFQPWRIKIREAEEALDAGQLEEASRLLRESSVREFLPAKTLLAKVAGRMVQRAERRVAGGQSLAGWRDLEAARSLGADAEAVTALRQAFVARRLGEAESYLAAGEPAAAVARLDELARHGDTGREVRAMREAAAKMLAAQRHCRRGQFGDAEQELGAAAALVPELKALDDARKACRVKAAECRRLGEKLHEALVAQNWTPALAAAEAILELCPDHEPARDARRRAWAAVGMRLADSLVRPAVLPHRPVADPVLPANGKKVNGRREAIPLDPKHCVENPIVKLPTADGPEPGARLLLWVDGVGGYLVCLADEVTLGQPVPGNQVDVPILGDVSSRHAKIRRDGESYVIDPLRPVRLDGREISGATTLADGSQIELGGNVRLRFRQPHPLSGTARLEFVSHHRTQPSADAVLLLAESCVLGPGPGSHIVCRDWPGDVVIYRQAQELHCRAPGRFEIDGREVVERGPLAASSQVVGDDFSFNVEFLDKWNS